jgi:HNH endonuclease
MPVDDLRAAVSDRAGRRCEYCRAPEEISGIRYHMDHVLPVARGGSYEIANRAFACPTCNQAKSVKTEFPDPFSSKRVKLFNPRIEDWQANFRFVPATLQLEGLTPAGRATVKALNMNVNYQLEARSVWYELGIYP